MEVMRLLIKVYSRPYDNEVPGKHYIAGLVLPGGFDNRPLKEGEPRATEQDAAMSLLKIVQEKARD
jgi:hypothetical protein